MRVGKEDASMGVGGGGGGVVLWGGGVVLEFHSVLIEDPNSLCSHLVRE